MKSKLFLFAFTLFGISTFSFAQNFELWGTTACGLGGGGGIHAYNPFTNTVIVKHEFVENPGMIPSSDQLTKAQNGKFYGVTMAGGSYSLGVIFEYDPISNLYTKKFDFDGAQFGGNPIGGLVQANNGKLYGMTSTGGAQGSGVLFEYNVLTNSYTKKLDLNPIAHGSHPTGALIVADNGLIYGMIGQGGANNLGVLFSYDPLTNIFVKKLDFDALTKGGNPFGKLYQANNGNFYGMTTNGGKYDLGVFFEFNPSSDTYLKLLDFNGGSLGSRPFGNLIEVGNGKLYGMTAEGGINDQGVIFEFEISTSTYTKKLDFNSATTGLYPKGSLLEHSNGMLYGMTISGGLFGFGTLFEYDPTTSNCIKKIDFDGEDKGSFPIGSLIADGNGNLLGITESGGTSGQGVLFVFDVAASILIKKIDFHKTVNGSDVVGKLVQSENRKLYGLASNGGNGGNGVLFEFDPATITYIKKFDFLNTTMGSVPSGSLLQASNGILYGLTKYGGNNDEGVLFEYNPITSTYIKKVDFERINLGSNPGGSLVEALNGSMYGLTTSGGIENDGILFEFDINTNMCTKRLDFSYATSGSSPFGCLVLANNGKMYGLTKVGGSNGKGVLFEFDPLTNTLIKKIDFDGVTNGCYPMGNLILAPNGKLYGMASEGGAFDYGVLFEFDPSSSIFSKKLDFQGRTNGNLPIGSLILASNGKLYGMTTGGGNNGRGVLFEYDAILDNFTKRLDFQVGSIGGCPNGDLTEVVLTRLHLAVLGNNQTIANNGTPLASNNTDFGKLASGVPVSKTFTVKNTGNVVLVLDATPVTLTGSSDFTLVAQPTPLTLAPNASTTFQVTFTPSIAGLQTAEVHVASNAPTSPFIFKVQGTTNTALDFDGVNDYVSISDNFGASLAEFTIEAWVLCNGTTNTFQSVFATSGTDFVHLQLHDGGGNNVIYTSSSTSILLPIIPETPYGAWKHVALVAKSGASKVYVDGVQIGTTNTQTFSSIPVGTNNMIGAGYQNGRFFKGMIDEVRIWNRALCEQEILGRKNISLQGNENGLLAYYDFEEGIPSGNNSSLTEVKDIANLNNGTLNNFAKTGATSNWVSGGDLTDDGLITGASSLTWNGTTSTDWNTATNWTPNSIPSQCDDVLIPTTTNNPTFSNNQAVNSITIESSATLTVGAGGCFFVGSTFANNGDFILQANSSNYAQYQGPQVKGTLSQVIGEAGWHNIASPFIDATLGDIEFDQNAVLQFGNAQQTSLHYYDGGAYQPAPPNSWQTAWGSWVPASGLTDVFDGSLGYNLYLDNTLATAFPVKMTVTGTLRNMPITPELNGANGGWNLLSNPFPSVIDWEKWSNNSAITSTYYVWDAATNNYNTYMTGGTSVPAATLTQYIAPYQSVFVKTSNGTILPAPTSDEPDVFQDHLTSNADRPTECPSAINQFYKTDLTGDLHLEVRTQNGKFADELAIRFGNDFSEGFVADEEAIKFFSPAEEVPQIYTIIDNKPFVISSFPQPQNVVQHIPLGIKGQEGKRLSIAALEIPEGITAILEDKEKDEFHNLKTAYGYTSSSVLANNRFVLHLGDVFLTADNLGASQDYVAYLSDGVLKFVYNEKLFGGAALLMNMAGQVVAKTTVTENGTMQVSHLPLGLYIITVQSKGKIYSQKLVVK